MRPINDSYVRTLRIKRWNSDLGYVAYMDRTFRLRAWGDHRLYWWQYDRTKCRVDRLATHTHHWRNVIWMEVCLTYLHARIRWISRRCGN